MKFDKKSTYGRMTAIGEKHMKHSTFEKAAKAALCSLLLLSMAAQTDLTMAFGFGTADEELGALDGDFLARVLPMDDHQFDFHRVSPLP